MREALGTSRAVENAGRSGRERPRWFVAHLQLEPVGRVSAGRGFDHQRVFTGFMFPAGVHAEHRCGRPGARNHEVERSRWRQLKGRKRYMLALKIVEGPGANIRIHADRQRIK